VSRCAVKSSTSGARPNRSAEGTAKLSGVESRLADWLERRPQLGQEVFGRGAAEPATVAQPQTDIVDLLRACLELLELPARETVYRPQPPLLWRVPDALAGCAGCSTAFPKARRSSNSYRPHRWGIAACCSAAPPWPARWWPASSSAATAPSCWSRTVLMRCGCSHFAPIRHQGAAESRQFPLLGPPRGLLFEARPWRLSTAGKQDHMKIVIATTPAPGHVNPMLGIARTLLAEGHEVVALTGSAFQDRVEGMVPRFARSLPARIRTWWIPSRSTPN
jgi:hypothetical protein